MNWLLTFANHCSSNLFLGIPNWSTGLKFDESDCSIASFVLSDIWVVVANIARIALAVAGLVAVVFILIGAFQYITSSGNPDRAKAALSTITNAIIGLVIAILASAIVGFVGRIF